MSGYIHDGMVFGVVYWKFIAGMALLSLSVLAIGCGVNVCWARFSRHRTAEFSRVPDQW